MTRNFPFLAILLATAACQAEPSPENEAAATTPPANQAGPQGSLPPATAADNVAAPSSPSPGPSPAPSEPEPTPDDVKSPAAAVAVLRDYCDAIAHKDYGSAYRKWAADGQAAGMSERQFADSFAKYDAFDCSFGPAGPIEGAAGSAYITIPVVVTGTLTKGGGFVMRGPITLKRVNDVPGSTAEQRRWHISSSGLKPRP